MTKKEMTEVFSVMMLAWPNAEMFKGGIQKLAPTIELWTACLSDVDYWLAQQAVVRLCKECKFPPTIAEFRERVQAVRDDMQLRIDSAFQRIRSATLLYGSLEEFYAQLPPGDMLKTVIGTMGGVQALTTPLDKGGSMWNFEGFRAAYTALIRNENALEGGRKRALTAARKEDL